MQISIFQVDAFTDRRFSGNPAAVCPLDCWLSKPVLQSIAAENNLSETAFFVAATAAAGDGESSLAGGPARGDNTRKHADFELRWFTPTCEVELCGHATLASAFVLYECLGTEAETIRFFTRESGILTVTRKKNSLCMDFPAQPCSLVPTSDALAAALNANPVETWQNASHQVAVFASAHEVAELRPDFAALARLGPTAIIATARDDDADFVSRFFAPAYGIDEDPVTGSAHSTLAPLWSAKLGKDSLHGRQLSLRGGDVYCKLRGDRVELSGRCALYLTGTITIG